MNKSEVAIRAIMICILLTASTTLGVTQERLDDMTELSFTVLPVKTRVLPFETLEFVFTLCNETGQTKRVEGGFEPFILCPVNRETVDDTETLADGMRWDVYGPDNTLLMPPVFASKSFAPGEAITRVKVLGYEKGKHKLARPGRHLFKGQIDRLISNTVEIVVEEPEGIDKAAHEYLQQYSLHYYLHAIGGLAPDQATVEKIEMFISRFRGSQYAEMAKLGLALRWVRGVEGKKDLEQARSLLQEVAKSSDEARAARAYYYLGQLAEEQGQLMDAHQYYSRAVSLKVDPYIEYVTKEAQAKIEPRLSPPPRRQRRR
jgi:hypothetical protein